MESEGVPPTTCSSKRSYKWINGLINIGLSRVITYNPYKWSDFTLPYNYVGTHRLQGFSKASPARRSFGLRIAALVNPIRARAAPPHEKAMGLVGGRGGGGDEPGTWFSHMGVSKNRGTPKWMVYNGKPYQNGWFGGTTIFGNIHIYREPVCLSILRLLQKKAIFFYSQPRVEERVPGLKMVDSIGCFQSFGKWNVCFYPKDPDMS